MFYNDVWCWFKTFDLRIYPWQHIWNRCSVSSVRHWTRDQHPHGSFRVLKDGRSFTLIIFVCVSNGFPFFNSDCDWHGLNLFCKKKQKKNLGLIYSFFSIKQQREQLQRCLILPAKVIHNFEREAKSVLQSSIRILIPGYKLERTSVHFLINVQIPASIFCILKNNLCFFCFCFPVQTEMFNCSLWQHYDPFCQEKRDLWSTKFILTGNYMNIKTLFLKNKKEQANNTMPVVKEVFFYWAVRTDTI